MIGFVMIQSVTDIVGHGLAASDIGAGSTASRTPLIADQRALWMFLLLVLAFRGAGPLSLDRMIKSWAAAPRGTGVDQRT